jgi:hypothetical protein
VVVSEEAVRKFCHYCGVFAATKLFVEIGLPTALLLATSEIITEEDIELKGKALWPDGFILMTGNFKKGMETMKSSKNLESLKIS